MSKVVPATCAAGVVTANSLPLTSAEIFSEGVGSSEGVAIIDEDDIYYLAKITPDLKTVIEKMLDAIGAIKSAVSAIATGPVTLAGASAGPTAVALASSLNTNVTALAAAETALNALKGALR